MTAWFSTVKIIHTPQVELVAVHGVELWYKLSNVCEGLPRLDQALRMDLASVTEYIDVVFKIVCSRVASHQLVRHRLTSIVQLSQRRSVQPKVFLVPRRLMEHKSLVRSILHETYEAYDALRKCGVPIELARYVLPNCAVTELFLKANLREIVYIINLRMCSRAQPETRYIAMQMAKLLWYHFPELKEVLAPWCVRYGYCKYAPDVRDPEKLRRCRQRGYEEAIREHGTEYEVERLSEAVAEFP